MLASRGVLALAMAGASLGCARPPPREPYPVNVKLESGGRPVRMELIPDSADTLLAPHVLCSGTCYAGVWSGRYRLHAEARWVSTLDRRLALTESSRIRVVPGNALLRDSGMFLAVVSMIAVPVTFLLFFDCGHGYESHPNCTGWALGLGGAAAGTGVGWAMYGAGKSDVQVTPLYPYPPPIAARLHLTASRDRSVVSWELRF